MNKKLALILVCSLASGLMISGCSEPEAGDPCVPGTKACMDGAVKICYNNHWVDLEVCDSTKPVCDPVNFVCTTGVPECTEADNKCENGVLSRCTNGYLYQQNCKNSNQVCGTDAAGQPACVFEDAPLTCTPSCVNGVYTGCNADGSAMAPVNCADSGKVCGQLNGVAACVEDVEEPPVSCTPTCVNDVYVGCSAAGIALAPVKCSDSGKVCGQLNGVAACVEDVEEPPVSCTPTCENDVYVGCNADGSAMAPLNCSDSGKVCGEVDGVAACVEVTSGLTCPEANGVSCQTLDGQEWAVFCLSGEVIEDYSVKCEAGEYCDEDIQGCVKAAGCGNGAIDAGEDCDLENLNDMTCASVLDSYSATGTLKCTSGCKFDTSECVDYYCGNGILEDYEVSGQPGETCDDKDFGGLTCTTYKNDGKTYTGSLACTNECGIDDSDCVVEEVVAPSAYTKIKDIRTNYNNIVSIGSDHKCSIVEAEGAKSVNVKGLVTAVNSTSGKKGTFFVQGDEALDNAAIPVYCKENCNVSVTNLADLEGKVVTVSGTGVMGLYGCGLQLVHTNSKPVVITVVTDTVNVTPKTLKIADIGVNTPSTPYAGMLLKVENATLTEEIVADKVVQYLNQGADKMEPSGYVYKYAWTVGTKYTSVTGVLHYVNAGYLAPRRDADVVAPAPCVGKCEGGKYYACVDGTLSSTGTAQPTTANGSYTCDVNKGWVLSCDTGYTLSSDGTSCVEVSSGGGNTINIDFTAACDASTNCSKSGKSSYDIIRTYTLSGGVKVVAKGDDGVKPGISFSGDTNKYGNGIFVTGLSGVQSVKFEYTEYGASGDKKGVVTVGSVVDEYNVSSNGTFNKTYNNTTATEVKIEPKSASSNRANRHTVKNLEIIVP